MQGRVLFCRGCVLLYGCADVAALTGGGGQCDDARILSAQGRSLHLNGVVCYRIIQGRVADSVIGKCLPRVRAGLQPALALQLANTWQCHVATQSRG
jgi:hypothetical protein